jgi:hypothetical protein
MMLEALLMCAPLAVALIYRESFKNILAFLLPIGLLFLLGGLMQIPKPKRTNLYQKEGFALTAMVWIVMAVFGAIPFVLNGDIPNYADACFEIMSGFTTTGASIVVEGMSVGGVEICTDPRNLYARFDDGSDASAYVSLFSNISEFMLRSGANEINVKMDASSVTAAGTLIEWRGRFTSCL